MSGMEDSAGRLADHWMALMSDITWKQASASIYRRLPRPCGETTQIPEGDHLFDVSDSWEWAEEADGDIRLTVEVYDCSASDKPLAVRKTVIRRA